MIDSGAEKGDEFISLHLRQSFLRPICSFCAFCRLYESYESTHQAWPDLRYRHRTSL